MSKADERALQAYPSTSHYWNSEPDRNSSAREFFKQGYRQAEKDLALTWEDIHTVAIIEDKLIHELCIDDQTLPQTQAFYKEVLKRFNETKKK